MKARHVFAIMTLFANFNSYILRNNINVAIVAMANSSTEETLQLANDSSITVCPARNHNSTSGQVRSNLVVCG